MCTLLYMQKLYAYPSKQLEAIRGEELLKTKAQNNRDGKLLDIPERLGKQHRRMCSFQTEVQYFSPKNEP